MKIDELIPYEYVIHGQYGYPEIIKKIVEFLEINCSQILSIYNNEHNFLYRGVAEGSYRSSTSIFLGQSRENRSAKDTPTKIQLAVDEKLKEAGFTALRSNSIFCTSNLENAENYGVLYIIFPVNGFDYMWNAMARDFFDYFSFSDNGALMKGIKELSGKEFASQLYFKNNIGIDRAIGIGHEVCIHGKYVAIRAGIIGKDILKSLELI